MGRGPLLLVLVLCAAAQLCHGASVRLSQPDVSSGSQQCILNRRRIMEDARRYYKAKYETKLLLYKIRIHRQQLVEKRLRYLNLMQRMKLRHNARIQQRVRRFRKQVSRAKVAYRRKLKFVTKRYQRRVMRKLKRKPLSNQRIRQIKKAFFRRGIISKRAAAIARRPISAETKSSVRIDSMWPSRPAYEKRSYTRRSSPVRRKSLRLRSKKTVEDRIARFTVWRRRILRGFHRELNFRLRYNRHRQLRKRLKLRINRLTVRRNGVTRKINLCNLERQKLRRRLEFLQSRRRLISNENRQKDQAIVTNELSSKITRIAKRVQKYNKKIKILVIRRGGLKRRIGRNKARRTGLQRRMRNLRRRMRHQLRETKRLFTRAIEHLTRWKATNPEIYSHARGVNNAKFVKLSRTGKPIAGFKTLTRREIESIINTTRKYHRADGQFFRNILESEQRLSEIKRNISRQVNLISVCEKQLLALTLRIKANTAISKQRNMRQVNRLQFQMNVLQTRIAMLSKRQMKLKAKEEMLRSKIAGLHKAFALNFRTWTWNLTKVGLGEYFQVLQNLSNAATEVRKRKTKRMLRRIIHANRAVKQSKLIRKLSLTTGVSKDLLQQAIERNDISRQRGEVKRLARRIVKRLKSMQRKILRTTNSRMSVSRREFDIHRRKIHVTRRILRIRARRHRLKRRIQAIEIRIRRLSRRLRRFSQRELAIRRVIARKPPIVENVYRQMAKKLNRNRMRINRFVRKIAAFKLYIAALKRRRFRLRIRIGKNTRRLNRLDSRNAAVKERIKRHSKRLAMLVTKKRRFLRRVEKNATIRHNVIRRVAKLNEKTIGGYLHGRSSKNARRRKSLSEIRRYKEDDRFDTSKSTAEGSIYRAPPRLGHKSEFRTLNRKLTLRRVKSVDEIVNRFTSMLGRYSRAIQRTLYFHLRKKQLKLIKIVLQRRLQTLWTRIQALNDRIISKQHECHRLKEKLRVLMQRRERSIEYVAGKRNLPSNTTESAWKIRSLTRRISKCRKRIIKLRARLLRLKRRIARTTARKQRIRHRVKILNQRILRQHREGRQILVDGKYLATTNAFDTRLVFKIIEENKLKYIMAKKRNELERSSILKNLTRSTIRNIIDGMKRGLQVDVQICRRNIILHRLKSRIQLKKSKLALQVAHYSKKALSLQTKLRGVKLQNQNKNKNFVLLLKSRLRKVHVTLMKRLTS